MKRNENGMKKVTIKDIARKSGVGIATVSRVINNNYPVSDETAEAVLAAIEELNYRPNAVARSLKTQQTKMIGVVVADVSNKFFMEVVKGVESIVSQHGYNIIIASHEENPEKEREIIDMFVDNSVAAIVTTTCQIDGDYFSKLYKNRTPVVLVDREIFDHESNIILEDNKEASKEIVNHLIKNGHKKIAVINGRLNVSTAKWRFEGYLEALEENGITYEKRYQTELGSYERIKAMFTSMDKEQWPTAIYTTNNTRLENCLKVILEYGLKVPEDISIVSFGNISAPWLFESEITHIEQNAIELGQLAGELVVKKIETLQPIEKIIVKPVLIEGTSVKNIKNS